MYIYTVGVDPCCSKNKGSYRSIDTFLCAASLQPRGTGNMSLMTFGVEMIKQYPGQEQVDLSVEICVPGSWFSGTAIGALTAAERRESYLAQAVEYADC